MSTKNQENEVQTSQPQTIVYVVSVYQNLYGVYAKIEDAQIVQMQLVQKGRIASLVAMPLL